jgi:hypothetical protein
MTSTFKRIKRRYYYGWEFPDVVLKIVLPLLIVCTVIATVIDARADAKCLAKGYPRSEVSWDGRVYCLSRVNYTDRVIPLEQIR